MGIVEASKIRNIAIVGHGHTGKTSFVSALLFDSGAVNRLGKVDQGNTITDFDPEEIERKITISSALCFCEWRGNRLNIVDTPGYGNFIMDTKACLRGVDSAVMLVCGVSGVEVQTEKIWEIVEEFGLPRIFVINKLDRENSDFERALNSLKESFGRGCIPIQLPIGKEIDFKGLIDLIKMKAYIFERDENGSFEETGIPPEMLEIAKKKREELMEMVAENDETLMSSFFEKGELDENELREGLRKAVRDRLIYPVLGVSSLLNIGIQLALDSFVEYLPSPIDRGAVQATQNGKEIEVIPFPDQPFSAFVFKTVSDPYAGRISIFRVFSGKISPDSTIMNTTKEVTERLGGLFYLQGKQQVFAPIAQAGDILATARLKATLTGDTLVSKDNSVLFEPLKFPQSSISFAIEPKTRQDEEKISTALQRIAEEDPTIRFERDPQTKELLISGNGQLHVEIIVARLKKRYNVDVILRKPKIPYKETIKGTSDVQGKYKKQTGGRGQYGDVKIKMEPLPRGMDFEFVDQIFGGAIPKNYIPSVEKGIQEARQRGVLAGYPVVDFKVILYDGSYHEVDSSDIAFKIAASMAFKKGMSAANPTILEPIMNVEIYVPEAYLGDIMGNLNGRRGRIIGVEERGGKSVIKAQVPMAEMLDFEPSLTSITGGRGSYSMEFSHYEEVPAHLQQKIIAQAKEEGKIPEEEE
ncbi:MAG: elongation factor G [Candidatus Aminicenantia bacterium]